MKKMINGIVYSTEASKQIGVRGNVVSGNLKAETLYKTREGYYFLYDRQIIGAGNEYAGKITPLKADAAEKWAKEYLGEFAYAAEFGISQQVSQSVQISKSRQAYKPQLVPKPQQIPKPQQVSKPQQISKPQQVSKPQQASHKTISISLPQALISKLEQQKFEQGKSISQIIESVLIKEGFYPSPVNPENPE